MSARSAPTPLLAAFQESYHDLVRFVARRTGCRQDARELVHDTWLRLAERQSTEAVAPQGDGPAPRAYVYTVAENITIDHLRRRQRGQERFTAAQDTPDGPLHEPATHDVAERCVHREALDAVSTALQQLPLRRRDIFLADRLDGASHAELAQRHGISVQTVEREVARAMDGIEAALHRWRGDTAPVRHGRRRALSSLLGVAGMGAGSAAVWQAWRQWVPVYNATLATATGRIQSHTLPDGSRITLDAASRVAVSYYAGRRSVQLLAGSAFFDVVRDAERPFTVSALGHEVTVLGTRFEVALQDGGLRVAVESGQVRVRSASGEEQVLDAGDSARIDAARQLSTSHPGAATAVAPWREGWLDFPHTPLGEVAARLARYSPRPLRVEPAAAGLPVVGRVHIADSAAWLRLLPGSLPVRVREEGAERALVISLR